MIAVLRRLLIVAPILVLGVALAPVAMDLASDYMGRPAERPAPVAAPSPAIAAVTPAPAAVPAAPAPPSPAPGPSAAPTTVADPAPATRLPAITVVSAAREHIAESVVVSGTLVPREEILVNAEIDGYAVTDILVEEGDRVTAGQVLARLSQATLEALMAQQDATLARADAAIAQARAEITRTEASKVEAERALERAKTLRQTGTATIEQLDQRTAAAQVAAAQLGAAQQGLVVAEAEKRSAEAAKRELTVRWRRTEIKAPTAGVISRRTARIGAVATMQGGPLFRIIRDGAIELEADVPETVLARMRPGMAVAVTPAGRETPVQGRIRLVAPEIDQTSRLGRVRIALDGAMGLTIGAYARGLVEVARSEGIVLPISAVLVRDRGARVQVVKDGVVETREVKLGLRTAGRVEITSGVAEGEDVVAVAGIFVRDGDKVAPVRATPGPVASR